MRMIKSLKTISDESGVSIDTIRKYNRGLKISRLCLMNLITWMNKQNIPTYDNFTTL